MCIYITHIPSLNVMHGNSNTHITHSLCTYKGLLYCNVCGSRGGKWGFQHLSKQCVPPSQYGLTSLRAIKDGRLPPNLTAWPDDERIIDRPPCQGSKPICQKSKSARATSYQGVTIKRPVPIFSAPVTENVTAPFLSTVRSNPTTNVLPVLPDYLQNIQDLLDLHNDGEPVVWPFGLSALTAPKAISDYLTQRTSHQKRIPVYL